MFSCEFCKIFKNIIFIENLQTTASEQSNITNEKYCKNKHFIWLLPSTFFYSARQKSKNNYINIKIKIYLTFVSNLLCFGSRVFIFIVFWISSNKLSSISRGICWSFKSRHLKLFCKIIIQLFSPGIFLGLWSRGPPHNFTEQLFFLHSCA